jgi:PAS domain S-box-containing protein
MGTDSRPIRLAVAVLAAMVALFLRMALEPLVGPAASFLCFVPGVVLSAWYGGFKPGMLTTVVLAIALVYIDAGNPSWAGLGLFALSAISICAALQALRLERRKAEQTEQRLHDVLESTQDAVLSIDNDLLIGYANARAGQIAKKAPAQLFGRSLRTVFPETPQTPIYLQLHRALRDRAAVHFEDKLDGPPRCYEFHAYPVPQGLNLFIRDVTAARAAEAERWSLMKQIEAERARFEAVLREMPVGVLIASPRGKVELINQKALDIFGPALGPGDDVPAHPIHPASTGETVSNYEAEYVRPDGSAISVVINSVPLPGADGRRRGVLSTYFDVTPNREMQKALRESETRLRRLFESPIIGMLSGDGDRVLDANNALLQMLGYTRAELEAGSLRWTEFTPPEFLDADLRGIQQLTERGFADPYEKIYIAKDGRRVPVLAGVAAIEPGQWSPWISWVLDLSEHRRLEERLRETGKLESVGLLAGGVAHDFNNILTGILGNASLALELMAPDHAAHGLIENAIQATERAADLTRQLLAYAGKGRFIVRPVDISQLAREIGQLIRTSIPRSVELRLDLAGDLPAIEADGTQIQQLIMNLVINGAEAIGDNAGAVRVTTGMRDIDEGWLRAAELDTELPVGRYVFVEVQDTGCGMDEDTRRHIFDPFFSTKFTGRGLGLAAANGIVRGHHGAICVHSMPGLGSAFLVLLPVLKAVQAAAETVAPTAPAQGSGTILVVDDEVVVRLIARRALERYGYSVLLASNGREALEVYRGRAETIAMVILDMTMPLMGGEETMRNLRAMNADAKVLLTSGYGEEDTVQRIAGDGAGGSAFAGFIQKPYTAAALAAKVREILDAVRGDAVSAG